MKKPGGLIQSQTNLKSSKVVYTDQELYKQLSRDKKGTWLRCHKKSGSRSRRGQEMVVGQSLHCITEYPKHYLTAISTCSLVPDLSGSGKRATTTHASFVAIYKFKLRKI